MKIQRSSHPHSFIPNEEKERDPPYWIPKALLADRRTIDQHFPTATGFSQTVTQTQLQTL